MTETQRLSRQAIDDLKAIYQEEFGKTLSDAEVQEMAVRLLRFFGILFEAPTDKLVAPQSNDARP